MQKKESKRFQEVFNLAITQINSKDSLVLIRFFRTVFI